MRARRILRRDASAARTMPGIHAVLLAEDVPGLNDVGAVRHDEILLADDEVLYHGQIVALVVGETPEPAAPRRRRWSSNTSRCRALLDESRGDRAGQFSHRANFIRRGDCDARAGRSAA